MERLYFAIVSMVLVFLSAHAQKASELKYHDVRELGLPIVNQGFKDCVRMGSSEKDLQVKDAIAYDKAMQQTGETVGKSVPTDETVNDGYYTRLSARLEGKVRKAVWDLGQNSSGLAVRFRTNSTTLGARWTLLKNNRMNHMAPTGICGFDLYALDKGTWRFVGTAQPNGKKSINLFRSGMDGKMRDFVAFFPLYDGVTELAIGIDENAVIEQPTKNGGNPFGGTAVTPLVFYGTSITQGGCATRPGMVHTNILSRRLKRECINLGFSGNGRMDKIMAEEMARIDAGAYIMDCIGNCRVHVLRDSTFNFIRTLAAARPRIPIIMLSNYPYQFEWIDESTHRRVMQEDSLWHAQYKQLRTEGFKNLRYIHIGGKNYAKDPYKGAATGEDNECAVDGDHLTDLGFLRWSNFMFPHLKKIK